MGSVIGSLLGNVVTFNTKGLDFVLTALFVVIFVGQWKSNKDHKAAIIGILCSVVSLVIFGPSSFIIPAMIAIIAVLLITQKRFEEEENLKEEGIQ